MREIEGSCSQASMAVDTSITNELTNNLFNSIKVNGNGTESKGNNVGFQLSILLILSFNHFKLLTKYPIHNQNQFQGWALI